MKLNFIDVARRQRGLSLVTLFPPIYRNRHRSQPAANDEVSSFDYASEQSISKLHGAHQYGDEMKMRGKYDDYRRLH